MKNRVLYGGVAIFVVGLLLISIGVIVISSNVKTLDFWTKVDDNIYRSPEIKLNDESLLILSHGDVKFYLVNSTLNGNLTPSHIVNASISPIETTDREAIYDLESGGYTLYIFTNFTPHASIVYISLDILIVYGVIVLAGLVLFILGIILIPMAIISSRRTTRE